jgi:hypothetical protein
MDQQEKDAMRATIALHTKEFRKRGGKIDKVHYSRNQGATVNRSETNEQKKARFKKFVINNRK